MRSLGIFMEEKVLNAGVVEFVPFYSVQNGEAIRSSFYPFVFWHMLNKESHQGSGNLRLIDPLRDCNCPWVNKSQIALPLKRLLLLIIIPYTIDNNCVQTFRAIGEL